MRRSLGLNKETILYIKWKHCLLFKSGINKNFINQSKECDKIYNLYLNQVKKNNKKKHN